MRGASTSFAIARTWAGIMPALLFLTACSTSGGGSDATGDAATGHRELPPGATAPLFNDLGDHTRSVTTRSPLAQRYFDQGLVLT